MRILAVTCCTGGEELVAMTEQCSTALQESAPKGLELVVSVVAQGAERPIESNGVRTFLPTNLGFARGMNRAIEEGLRFCKDPDFVLCFNNDLVFPHRNWLRHLLDVAEQRRDRICLPATDKTALHKQSGPSSAPSFDCQEASAYCWLVPWAWCQHLQKTQGWWLFDPEFFAYGEDNWTAFLLSKAFGRQIFRMVPRSFVRHLRHRTSSHVKVDRKRSNRLLVDRLQRELQDRKLRPDLQAWAKRYIAVLSKRL